jgi:uncharacterized membrane protein
MTSKSEAVSIWFFVGILLAFYGLVITAEGLYHLAVPPAREVVLAWLHADLWWGALLLATGLFYCYHFAPRKTGARTESETHGEG